MVRVQSSAEWSSFTTSPPPLWSAVVTVQSRSHIACPRPPPSRSTDLESTPSYTGLAMLYNLLPTTLQLFLTSLLWHPRPSTPPSTLQFQLRHQHALSNTSRVIFFNTNPDLAFTMNGLSVRTAKTTAPKPVSQALLRSTLLRGGSVPWEPAEVNGPDIQHTDTMLSLAAQSGE